MVKQTPQSLSQISEMIAVDDTADQVACDGGGGSLGHPLVYYTFDGQTSISCGYCDRTFVKSRSLAGARKV